MNKDSWFWIIITIIEKDLLSVIYNKMPENTLNIIKDHIMDLRLGDYEIRLRMIERYLRYQSHPNTYYMQGKVHFLNCMKKTMFYEKDGGYKFFGPFYDNTFLYKSMSVTRFYNHINGHWTYYFLCYDHILDGIFLKIYTVENDRLLINDTDIYTFIKNITRQHQLFSTRIKFYLYDWEIDELKKEAHNKNILKKKIDARQLIDNRPFKKKNTLESFLMDEGIIKLPKNKFPSIIEKK